MGGVESEGDAREQSDLGVDGFDESVRQTEVECGFDVRAMARDGLGQLDEGRYPAAPCPLQPFGEDLLAACSAEPEDQA